MKKILCLLLSLVCVFMLFSCTEVELTAGEKFVEIINSKSPTKITTLYSYTLASGESASSKLVTEIEGNDSITTYVVERFATLAEAADGDVIRKEGVIYYKDGRYSEDNVSFTAEAPDIGMAHVKFNIDTSKMSSYEISEDLTTLTAFLTADEVKEILGLDVAIDGELELTVMNNGTYLTKVSVFYETVSGGSVQIDTSYTYNVVSLYD